MIKQISHRLLIPILLVAVLLGCNNDTEQKKIIISPAYQFSLSDETQSHLVNMYPHAAGNPVANELLFTNYDYKTGVVITDYDGDFINYLGNQGRGPDEVLSSKFFGAKGTDKLLILDKGLAVFKEFDRETEEAVIYDYPIKEGISIASRDISYCNGNWYAGIRLIGRPTAVNTPTIAVFNHELSLIDTLGGYDPFFEGRNDLLQDTEQSLSCDQNIVYTAQGKTPYIAAYSTTTGEKLGVTTEMPPSFNLSDKFMTMAPPPQEMNRFLSDEQSISLKLGHSENYLLLVFRNENAEYNGYRRLNESMHFLAVFDRNTYEFKGEIKLDGAVLGFTKEGYMISLKNQDQMEFELLEVSVR